MKKLFLFIVVILFTIISCDKDDTNEILQPDKNDYEKVFEEMWESFDRNYPYFELKRMDWDSVYSSTRPQITNGLTTSTELEDIFKNIVLSFKDLHTSFTSSSRTYYYSNRHLFQLNSPENAENYLDSIYSSTDNVILAKINDPNIIYLRIKNLRSDGNFSPFEEFLSKINNREGIIFDLRNNGGGSESKVWGLMNRLTEIERIFSYTRFRNGHRHNDFEAWRERKLTPTNPIPINAPILVLINRGVVSSGEGLTSMLKSLPNTILVGDTTRGSTANPKDFYFSNGWKCRISRWQNALPDLTLIEDNGIAPDIIVYNTKESINEGKDLMLEKAIDLIKKPK